MWINLGNKRQLGVSDIVYNMRLIEKKIEVIGKVFELMVDDINFLESFLDKKIIVRRIMYQRNLKFMLDLKVKIF